MHRIFGFYSYGNIDKKTVSKIRKNFEIDISFIDFIVYKRGNIFFDYQIANNVAAENFYYIDKKKTTACFITGNIFSFEKGKIKLLNKENKAKFVLNLKKKHGLDFIKYLRGEFNIILTEHNNIYLINDELGLSPMYTYRRKEGVFFCNDPEPLILLHKDNPLDYSSIAKFLEYGFVPGGKTFIMGLENQKKASIVKLSRNRIDMTVYSNIQNNLKNLPEQKKLKIIRDTLKKAIEIRTPEDKCHASLSGGWDTRLILANLTELKKQVTAITSETRQEEVLIAKMLASSLGLKHITYSSAKIPRPQKKQQLLRFEPVTVSTNRYYEAGKQLKGADFETTPRFNGLYGTELLGLIPPDFIRRSALRHNPTATHLLTKEFLSQLGKNFLSERPFNKPSSSESIIPFFLDQIGRTYLNTFYTSGWERPTRFFSYCSLNPFADSRFVRVLSSLKYPDDFYYKTYQKIYEKYYPEFLKFPWTFSKYRISNNLKRSKYPDSYSSKKTDPFESDIFGKNKEFKLFIRKNSFLKKNKSVVISRIKELYFLYEWFRSYQDYLEKKYAFKK